MLLAAQYESLLLPFPVILSLPAGVFGSYFFLQIAGLENNIYAQVALVMLIGLLGKNAILIIEMANQYRHKGMDIFTAAAGGMLVGTVVGIFLIPGLYIIFEALETRLKGNKKSYEDED